jgi:putative transposase
VPAGTEVLALEERTKMKQGQFTNEQIVAILQEAEKGEKPIIDLCKEKGISEATFYAWRKKFGGMQTKDVQRLKELEKENARLKRLLAEKVLENDVMKEALTKNW